MTSGTAAAAQGFGPIATLVKYLEFFRISFLSILAFRARYYVGIVSYIVYIAVYHAIWTAVYKHSTDIAGFDLASMTTYVAVGWISRSFMFNNLDRDIEARVIDGSLSMDLLKPVDFQGMQYARVFGEGLFRLVLFALPCAVVAFPMFGVSWPASFGAFLKFALSSALGALVFTNLNFMVGALALPLRSIEGIAWAKQNLFQFLSGLLVPFAFLPPGLATVLSWLPTAGISHTPLEFYLGRLPGAEGWNALALQAAWALITLLAGRALWNVLIRKVTIQGG